MAADPVKDAPAPVVTDDKKLTATPQARASNAGFLRRVGIGVNVLIQVLLAAIIVLVLNGIAHWKPYHFDWSRDHRFTLSARTKQFLNGLDKPMKVIVLISSNSLPGLKDDMTHLVEEYRNARSKYITAEFIDPYSDFTAATKLQATYKINEEQPNVVILDCEGRTQIIGANKLAEVAQGNPYENQAPRITAFTGEQAITGGMIEVVEGKKSTVYHSRGHGEPALTKGAPLEVFGEALASDHLNVAELNLGNVPAVPADATAVLIVGPTYDLTEREAKLLSDYWDRGGRLLVLLNPDAKTPHLFDVLQRMGIKPDDNRIYGGMAMLEENVINAVPTIFQGSTVIATRLRNAPPPFLGNTQSLTLTPAAPASGTKVEPLLLAEDKLWGEVDYNDASVPIANDPARDKQAPLYVAATVEKGAVGDERVKMDNARALVVGSSIFAYNRPMSDPRLHDFVLSSVNWLMEREALVGIPPRTIKNTVLDIRDDQLAQLKYILLFGMPGVCAFLGLIVWWWRRRS